MSLARRWCLKVDVDTHDGMRLGVPRLLEAFRDAGIRATFFLSFGPDNAGKAIWNLVRRPGFLSKMVRTNAPALYGWRTALSGTLLSPRPTAAAMPELVRRIADEGHEVGVHAWDHRLWQDHLQDLPRTRVQEQVDLACAAYEQILGHPPRAMAAPAWLVSEESLRLQDARGLLYASDMRGGEPGYPVLQGYRSSTLQVPTTQPCLEEVLALGHRDRRGWARRILAAPGHGAAVVPLHAEVEGGAHAWFLGDILRALRDDGGQVSTLEEYARDLLGRPQPPSARPACLRALPGRSGVVFTWSGEDAPRARGGA